MSNREKDKIEKPGHIYITFPEDINSLTHTLPILSYKHSINSYVQELHTFFFDRFRLTPRLQ